MDDMFNLIRIPLCVPLVLFALVIGLQFIIHE